MKEYLNFRKMITPWLVQALFWVAIAVFIIIAIVDIIQHVNYRVVLEIIIIGPLCARILAEILLLFFRMNDNLTSINQYLRELKNGKAQNQ
jgi:hypothetical protein